MLQFDLLRMLGLRSVRSLLITGMVLYLVIQSAMALVMVEMHRRGVLPFASIDALVPVPYGSTLFEEPVNSPGTACVVVGCFLALLLAASIRRA